MTTEEQEPLLTVAEAAERCHVHRKTLERWIREGHLEAITFPTGTIRIRESEVAKLLSS